MAGNKGSGNMSVGNRTPPATAVPITAANEGLSISGTTVQLGNSSILSALPGLSSIRHIPINGFSVRLNSAAVAAPDNYVELGAFGTSVLLRRQGAGGTAPGVFVEDLINNCSAAYGTRTIALIGNSATLGAPIFTISDVSAASKVTTIRNTTLTITDAGSLSNTLLVGSSTITNGVGPHFVSAGVNAAGAVVSSQFRNTSVVAAATVVSQWYIDNSAEDLTMVKHSNAHVTFPGGAYIQNLSSVANSKLTLRSSSSGGAAFVTVEVPATSEVARFSSTALTLGVAGTLLGQLNLAGNTSGTITIKGQAAAGTYNFNLPTTAGTAGFLLASGGGGAAAMTYTDPLALAYIKTGGNSTLTASINIDIQANVFNVVSTAYSVLLQIANSGTIGIGDVNGDVNGTAIIVDDSATTVTCFATGGLYTTSSAIMIGTLNTYANGAAAAAGTLLNAPAAGNPTKWIAVDDAGTTRHIPAW